jgi:chromosome partitioning protein
MRTIAIINQKGGCGKTTTAINLAAMLARAGHRTLLVDMDPQSHCAAGLGVPETRIELDIGDAMLSVGSKPLDQPRLLWRAARNLDLVPSRMRLAGLEASRGGLAELLDREKRLSMVLQQWRHDYDLACIDCPPSIGLLTYNALAACDAVVIPVETSFFSLQGATKQVNTVKTLSRRLGVQIPIWLLPTIHEEGNAVAGDLLGELHRRFRDRVSPVVIRRDARLREAASFGQPVADYAPESHGAEDYRALAGWVVRTLMGEGRSTVAAEACREIDTPEVHVPPISPRVLADRPAPAAGAPEPVADAEAEPKPVTRAEDVARRAQEFLRKVALGRTTAGDRSGVTVPQETAAPEVTVVSGGALGAGGGGTPLHLVPSEQARPASISPATARLLGVRETNQGVLFVQPLTCGERVSIAGTFNNWSPDAHVLKRNTSLGVHELCLRLPPGKIMYRLVIDGQWSADPHNNTCEPNPFGDINSVFVVGASRAMEQPA